MQRRHFPPWLVLVTLSAAAQTKLPYTTYESFQQLLDGAAAGQPKLIRVSNPDAGGKPAYTGFFFYQCLQFDASGRFALAMKVYFQNRPCRRPTAPTSEYST